MCVWSVCLSVLIGEDFRYSLQKMHRVAHHLPVCFIREKKMQLKEVEEMSLAKNGDMVRPQVRAVMDLLLAGIEIDTDFRKGVESIIYASYPTLPYPTLPYH